MVEGEQKASPAEQNVKRGGVDNIRNDIAAALDKVQTVKALVGLLSDVDAVNRMHTRLQTTIQYLEKQALHGSPTEQHAASEDLGSLEYLLEKAGKNPAHIGDLDPVLKRIEQEAEIKEIKQAAAA